MRELSEDMRALWEEGAQTLKQLGAEVVEVSLPHTQYALPAYYILAPAEASSNLSRYDGLRYGMRFEYLISSAKAPFVQTQRQC